MRENVKNLTIVFPTVALFMLVGTAIILNFNLATDCWAGKETSSSSNLSFAEVVQKVKPAVVNITAEKVVKSEIPQFFFKGPFEEFFREWPFYEQRKQSEKALGSGVIIDKQGYVLTNNHMIAGAEKITVKLPDERKFEAEVIGTDPETDIALLKLKLEDETLRENEVAKLGNSDKARIGDWVMAIGNAFGLEGTVTVGVISAKGRSGLSIEGGGPVYQSFIQTDAAINFGNSGGPLINLKGEVIGINTAIARRSQGAEGIGFAIPINMAKKVVNQLKSKGKVVRGYLGVYPQKITSAIAEAKGLSSTEGVLISQVEPDSPAEKGGLKRGDVIVRFAGKKVEDVSQFRILVAEQAPGKKVEADIIRDGEEKTLTFKLANRSKYVSAEGKKKEKKAKEWMGIEVKDVRSDIARSMGIKEKKGVVVINVEPGSPADENGIQRGDIILQVGKYNIEDLGDYQRAAKELRGRKSPILFLIKRGKVTKFIALKE